MAAIRKALRPEVIRLRTIGMSGPQIARELGVSKQTISDTLRLPEVQAAIEEAHAEARSELVSMITTTAREAVETLTTLMKDSSTPAAVRRQAASDLLDRAGIVRGLEVDMKHSANLPAEIQKLLGRLSDEELDHALGVETRDDFAMLTVLEAPEESA